MEVLQKYYVRQFENSFQKLQKHGFQRLLLSLLNSENLKSQIYSDTGAAVSGDSLRKIGQKFKSFKSICDFWPLTSKFSYAFVNRDSRRHFIYHKTTNETTSLIRAVKVPINLESRPQKNLSKILIFGWLNFSAIFFGARRSLAVFFFRQRAPFWNDIKFIGLNIICYILSFGGWLSYFDQTLVGKTH